VVPSSPTPLLDQIGRDLTQLAHEGKLKPLFRRQVELRDLQRILLRKEKNNTLLIGAPGVGKTALVEGLATLIVQQQTIKELHSLRIIEISSASLVAGTGYRGTFEAKMQQILREATSVPGLVLFIDEIHTLVRAGAVEGGALDAANILKPALARGDIRCIGATTLDESDQFLQSDPAFARRFEPLILEEPTESETVEILKGSLAEYESHHRVTILPEAIESAVKLSQQHILDRRLPDKAFDLLDTACTLVRLPNPENQKLLERQQIVDANVVSLALANKMNIPVSKLDEDFRTKLSGLAEFLGGRVFGQPLALQKIVTATLNAFSGLGRENQPRQVFAFFGSSGVGKTASAKALAEFLFDSPDALIRLDMSEYKEAHSISRLLGSPPGYIGYDDEGTFATRLRRQPFSVVLLDEIEKAHPEIHDAFLQIFDEGRFTDARGRQVEARHAIFILTSNLFRVAQIASAEQYEQQVTSVRSSLNTLFRPEFVNRIGELVLFKELSITDLENIAMTELRSLNDNLSRYDVQLSAPREVITWIAQQSYDPNGGARAVRRVVERRITGSISNQLIEGKLSNIKEIRLAVEDEKLVINYRNGQSPVEE
jgi:ATP-dependent Clp protease ATP-binding subunit ClpC